MPCHGDQGKGLTDEFRKIWVEDHQNCWAVGCHGGRVSDEGFPIRHYVPAVVSPISIKTHFPDARDLFNYLQTTHPPQRPGTLRQEDYLNLSSFILYKNGILTANESVGMQSPATIQGNPIWSGLIYLILMGIVSAALIIQARSSA